MIIQTRYLLSLLVVVMAGPSWGQGIIGLEREQDTPSVLDQISVDTGQSVTIVDREDGIGEDNAAWLQSSTREVIPEATREVEPVVAASGDAAEVLVESEETVAATITEAVAVPADVISFDSSKQVMPTVPMVAARVEEPVQPAVGEPSFSPDESSVEQPDQPMEAPQTAKSVDETITSDIVKELATVNAQAMPSNTTPEETSPGEPPPIEEAVGTATEIITATAAVTDVQAEPARKEKPEKEQFEDEAATIHDWARAWSSQDLESYLAFYDDNFVPADRRLDRESWEAQRNRRLTRPKRISVVFTDLQIISTGSDLREATFTQNYESNTYRDRIVKTIELVRAGEQWKILAEETIAVLDY